MDFVAIDIETANAQWGSVCAFGAAEVVGGTVAAHHGWLTRPPAPLDWFDGLNSSIHGIRAHMVAAAPTFAESLVRLLEIIDGRAVVAHNAAFDIGNIRRACTAEGPHRGRPDDAAGRTRHRRQPLKPPAGRSDYTAI